MRYFQFDRDGEIRRIQFKAGKPTPVPDDALTPNTLLKFQQLGIVEVKAPKDVESEESSAEESGYAPRRRSRRK